MKGEMTEIERGLEGRETDIDMVGAGREIGWEWEDEGRHNIVVYRPSEMP